MLNEVFVSANLKRSSNGETGRNKCHFAFALLSDYHKLNPNFAFSILHSAFLKTGGFYEDHGHRLR